MCSRGQSYETPIRRLKKRLEHGKLKVEQEKKRQNESMKNAQNSEQ